MNSIFTALIIITFGLFALIMNLRFAEQSMNFQRKVFKIKYNNDDLVQNRIFGAIIGLIMTVIGFLELFGFIHLNV
jgi:hypothetical protein